MAARNASSGRSPSPYSGPARPAVVVEPGQGGNPADPPIDYQLDVTDLVRSWLEGGAPIYGLAIAPAIDPSVDEGISTRFQIHGSQYSQVVHTEADGAGAAENRRSVSTATEGHSGSVIVMDAAAGGRARVRLLRPEGRTEKWKTTEASR